MKSLALGIALLAAGAAQAQQTPQWCAIEQPREIGYPFCPQLGPAGVWGCTVLPADSTSPREVVCYGPSVPVQAPESMCDPGSARCAALALDAGRQDLMGFIVDTHRDCSRPSTAPQLCQSLARGWRIWEIAMENERTAYPSWRTAPRYPWDHRGRKRDIRYLKLEGHLTPGFITHKQTDRIIAVLDEGPGAEVRECGLFVPMCQF